MPEWICFESYPIYFFSARIENIVNEKESLKKYDELEKFKLVKSSIPALTKLARDLRENINIDI